MKWLRMRRIAPTRLVDGTLRYYVDAVRSDGLLFRAGVDVEPSCPAEEADRRLQIALDGFLDTTYLRPENVGIDGHKGEDGWVEL